MYLESPKRHFGKKYLSGVKTILPVTTKGSEEKEESMKFLTGSRETGRKHFWNDLVEVS